MKHGGDPNLPDDRGQTAFSCAIANQEREIVERMIGDNGNYSQFYTACQKGDSQKILQLLRSSVGTNDHPPNTFSPLSNFLSISLSPKAMAILKGVNEEVVISMILQGANVNAVTRNVSPLIAAIYTSNFPLVNLLCDFGVKVSFRTSHNYSPLMLAMNLQDNRIAQVDINL